MENTTQGNLETAFSGESQANRRYLFYAEKAQRDGYPFIARLFRAVAEAETVHARNHLQVMGGIGTTEGNLNTAIKGENYEFMKMYPGFIDEAQQEDNQRAINTFRYANEVEQIHHRLFLEALDLLKSGKKPKEEPYFVCQVCGYTASGDAPDKCPICGAPRKQFKTIE